MSHCLRTVRALTMPSRASRHAAVAVSLAGMAGCVSVMPPPRLPSAAVPRELLSTATPSAGAGTVLVDVTDGPAQVEWVRQRIEAAASPQAGSGRSNALFSPPIEPPPSDLVPLCVTPCTVTLPPGWHELRLWPVDPRLREARLGPISDRQWLTEEDLFRVANTVLVDTTEPRLVRVTLGRRSDPRWQREWATGFLASGIAVAIASLPFLMVFDPIETRWAGVGLLGLGGVFALGGGIALGALPTFVQPAAVRVVDLSAHE